MKNYWLVKSGHLNVIISITYSMKSLKSIKQIKEYEYIAQIIATNQSNSIKNSI